MLEVRPSCVHARAAPVGPCWDPVWYSREIAPARAPSTPSYGRGAGRAPILRLGLPAMNFNAIDLLLALVILLSVWGGWRRGFVLATLELVALVVSLLAALLGYRWPAAWIESQWPWLGVWIMPLSFLALFLLAHLVLGSLAGSMVAATPRKVHVHAGNRLLGLAPGFVNGLINATVLAVVLMALPISGGLSRMVRGSEIAARLAPAAEWVEAQFTTIFDPAIRRSLQALTIRQESNQRVELPFKVSNPRPRPDLEARMLEMVNAERARQGLKPLQPDPEVLPVARAHSADMFARGYFAHVSPEGGDLSRRLRAGEVRYLLAGENLALAQTLPIAHQGLMNSPGHRANILRPQFGRVGIGVLDGGVYGLMVTQNFRN